MYGINDFKQLLKKTRKFVRKTILKLNFFSVKKIIKLIILIKKYNNTKKYL